MVVGVKNRLNGFFLTFWPVMEKSRPNEVDIVRYSLRMYGDFLAGKELRAIFWRERNLGRFFANYLNKKPPYLNF